MRNSVEANLQEWNSAHDWSADGDEWSGMARYCGQPYPEWKRSVVETFISPHVDAGSRVLEIAPGHGRWSDSLVRLAGEVTLVDLSPSCIEFCRERFAGRPGMRYIVNDGWTLPGVADSSIDFAFSFDSFVHMQPDVVASYLRELSRVLVPGGRAVIHHAGRRDVLLPVAAVRGWGKPGRVGYAVLSQGRLRDGWRGDVSRELFARMAAEAGLRVDYQLQRWGDRMQYDVRRFNDWVTTATKG